MTHKKLVYLSGPLTSSDPAVMRKNAEVAVQAFNEIAAKGFYVFCPHLFYYAALQDQTLSYVHWMSLDYTQMGIMVQAAKAAPETSLVLVRIPGNSQGADLERALAHTLTSLHNVPLEELTLSEWKARYGTSLNKVEAL